jgi:predicted NUDIX family NTP pyrophosphohydrolase
MLLDPVLSASEEVNLVSSSAKSSAGLMFYRRRDGGLEVFLVHPGGPFWARRDVGAWSIAKGEIDPGEAAEAAALREFEEETGFKLKGRLASLGSIRQAGGKTVHGFALEGDCDPSAIRSNTFELEWPPRSGKRQSFPEIDRADWFRLDVARKKINPAQAEFIDRLEQVGTKPKHKR